MQEASYVWSASNNAFFPKQFLNEYIKKGWSITDKVDVPDDIYHEFTQHHENKIRGVSDNGMPCWIDPPELDFPFVNK